MDFLTRNATVNYKPYEHSNKVDALSPEKAQEMFNKDLADMIEFFASYGLDEEKAKAATEQIWKKHLVNF